MPKPWITTRQPETLCPLCGKILDAASGSRGKPKPGDLAVCISCASPLRYADDLTLRAVTPAEIAGLHPKNRAELRRYMAAVRKLDRR